MSTLGYDGVKQKERTEAILKKITLNTPYIYLSNVKNTPVKEDKSTILDIFYRNDSIRINIHQESVQYSRYITLRDKGIAYQKDTADPNGASGIFAFFVDENNVEYALTFLLGL